MTLKFYLDVINHSLRNPLFREQALHEVWAVVKQVLPARLVTPKTEYVYCTYVGTKARKGRWLPPQSLKFRPSVYALIFDDQHRVLMVRSSHFESGWTLPGGGLNKGETLLQALYREVLEETGLEIEPGAVIDAHDVYRILPFGRPVQSQLHFFLAKVVGGKFRPDGNNFDATEVRFLDPSKIPPEQIKWYPQLSSLIIRAEKNFPANSTNWL